jgi:hypothetical protein
MKIIHQFFVAYYSTIIKDCLCEDLKGKIAKKINYHQSKLSA